MTKRYPIFKSIFGAAWKTLPPVLQKHYANRPYSNDVTTVRGKLDVMSKNPAKLIAPLLNLLGLIPLRNETGVPVTVEFASKPSSAEFQFNRVFNFQKANPHAFRSHMVQIRDNKVAEIMTFGFTWKMQFEWDGENIILRHDGYALYVFGCLLPLPLTFLLGSGYAVETAVDQDSFDMSVEVRHPWWGVIYGYKGRFTFE